MLPPYIDAYYEGSQWLICSKGPGIDASVNLFIFYPTPEGQEAFQSFINKQKGIVTNLLADPENYFFNQFIRIKTHDNPRAEAIPSLEDLDKINFDRVFEIYRERFSDASGFTFFFVGAFRIDSIKPLIETYLASLPSTRKADTWQDMGIRAPESAIDKAIYKGNDPKSMMALYLESPEPWTPEEAHMFRSLGSLLNIRYLDILREEMSGVYGFDINLNAGKDSVRTF